MNGKTKVSRAAFAKRKNLGQLKRLAMKFSEKEVVNYFVANLVAGDKTGGLYNYSADKIYQDWLRRMESITYVFKEDLGKLAIECEKRKVDSLYIFECTPDTHPLLLKMLLGGLISVETMVILENLKSYVETFDKVMYNDLVWNDVSRLIKKYKPFLKYDKKKIEDEYSRFHH